MLLLLERVNYYSTSWSDRLEYFERVARFYSRSRRRRRLHKKRFVSSIVSQAIQNWGIWLAILLQFLSSGWVNWIENVRDRRDGSLARVDIFAVEFVSINKRLSYRWH